MKIEYTITTETLGESSDADHQEYAHALLAALQTEYPDAVAEACKIVLHQPGHA